MSANFWSQIWSYFTSGTAVAGALAAFFGFIATQAWHKWKNRMSVLRWTATHTFYGPTGENPNLGHVEIMFNGAAVPNLHWSSVEVENESGHDLANVTLQLHAENESQFLSRGTHLGHQSFPWSREWEERTQRIIAAGDNASQEVPDDWAYYLRRRDFIVPVFNRDTKLQFLFFVNAPAGKTPYVSVQCHHLGVVTRQRPATAMILGVPVVVASRIGILVAAIIAFSVAGLTRNVWGVAAAALIAGLWGQQLGAGIVRLNRLMLRLLS
jgi:hypothetical protein